MKVIINNIATEYADEGSGQVILLLHGWLDSLRTFDKLSAELSENKRIIRLDLPGFGATEPPPTDWSLNNYVDFVAEFIGKLKLTDYALVGHSFGGRIAIKGCSTKKLTPKALVLMAAAGTAERRTAKSLAYTAVAKIGKVVTLIPPLYFWRKQLRAGLYKSAGSDYLASEHIGKTFLNIVGEDLSVNAPKITIPTLLIWGANDGQTPLREGKKLQRLIPRSDLVVLPATGHFVHIEKPEQVALAMEKFL